MIRSRRSDIESAKTFGDIAQRGVKSAFKNLKKSKTAGKKHAVAKKTSTTEPPVVAKNPSKAKVTVPSDKRTTGKNPTHKRSADTGRVSKLTPTQKAAVDTYKSPRQFPTVSKPPAADLRDFE
jgi:hypothetical protein